LLRLWKLRKKFLFRRKKKNRITAAILLFRDVNQSLLSHFSFSTLIIFLGTKKRERDCVWHFLVYGRFLVTSNASTAPIMIMTMMIATIPYSTVLFDAKPVVGVAVGAAVADAPITVKLVVSDDDQ
jgi:hypothetical protein